MAYNYSLRKTYLEMAKTIKGHGHKRVRSPRTRADLTKSDLNKSKEN